MPRYRIEVEYDGSPYCGWQRQPDAPSVQQSLESAIEKFTSMVCLTTGAGRTDTGVHALRQVAHFDCEKELDTRSIMLGLNFHLHGESISVVAAEKVSDDFHARFSALRRHYLYRILNRPARPSIDFGRVWHVPQKLDVSAMQQAAKSLVGHRDFSSFRSPICQAKSPMKTLDTLEVQTSGEEVHITTSARSFLHNQVRIMVGSLKAVGSGKWTIDQFQQVTEARDRSQAGQTAPSEGLYFVRVDY